MAWAGGECMSRQKMMNDFCRLHVEKEELELFVNGRYTCSIYTCRDPYRYVGMHKQDLRERISNELSPFQDTRSPYMYMYRYDHRRTNERTNEKHLFKAKKGGATGFELNFQGLYILTFYSLYSCTETLRQTMKCKLTSPFLANCKLISYAVKD